MAKHILIIDDEADVRELLREVLTGAGHRATGVSTAAAAMQVVQTDPPQLVITDLQLEETDGFALIEQMKLAAPHIPVILLTGVLFDPEVMKGPISGKIAAYVEKTTSLDRIMKIVNGLLPP